MRINARPSWCCRGSCWSRLTARPGAFRDFYRSGGGVVTLVVAGVLTAVGVAVLGRLGREPIESASFVGGSDAMSVDRSPRRAPASASAPPGVAALCRAADAAARAAGAALRGRRRAARSGIAPTRRGRSATAPRPAASLPRLFGPPLRALVAPRGPLGRAARRRPTRAFAAPGRDDRPHARRVPRPPARRGVAPSACAAVVAVGDARCDARSVACSPVSPGFVVGLDPIAAPARTRGRRPRGADPARALHGQPSARDARAHRRGADAGRAAPRRSRARRGRRGAARRARPGSAAAWAKPTRSAAPPSSRPSRARRARTSCSPRASSAASTSPAACSR